MVTFLLHRAEAVIYGRFNCIKKRRWERTQDEPKPARLMSGARPWSRIRRCAWGWPV